MTAEQWKIRKHFAVLSTVVIAVALGAAVGLALQKSTTTLKRAAAREVAFLHAQHIVQRLQEAVGPAYMLASLIQQSNGRIENFEAVGEEILQAFPIARAIELAPGGVVKQVYPLQGNEAILGHDLLKDRERNKEAHIALARRQLTIAGPFDLMQGGVGVVGRYPIFSTDRSGKSSFWGFSIVLIRVPELLNAAGIVELSSDGYEYELCRVPAHGTGCTPFATSAASPITDPVTVPVDVPNAHWQLAIAPKGGWVGMSDWLWLAGLVVSLAILLGGLQYMFLRRLQSKL